ncbi:hypothetical protein Cal6303_5454 [Calothrix sp. PCC 6303]|nr:hypothetical protein Cal6303_5454 [Calothrix sp. PCC 6303]
MERNRPRLMANFRLMKGILSQNRFKSGLLLGLLTLFTMPAVAKTANFGTITLVSNSGKESVSVSGYTGGSYSLSAIKNRDRNNNSCIGFADPNPDYILILKQDVPKLKMQVNSGGSDTTILVQGPNDNIIRCGDDTGRSKDANINDKNWKAGTYKLWIGTFNPGVKYNYTLSLDQS